jgi:hypothetical protein
VSREEAMNAFIESGMELRRDDIELGKRLERERIIELLEEHLGYGDAEWDSNVMAMIELIKGEQK